MSNSIRTKLLLEYGPMINNAKDTLSSHINEELQRNPRLVNSSNIIITCTVSSPNKYNKESHLIFQNLSQINMFEEFVIYISNILI